MPLLNDVADKSSSPLGAIALSIFKTEAWKWYHQHQNDTLFHKWWVTIKVGDCLEIFVALFGPEGA